MSTEGFDTFSLFQKKMRAAQCPGWVIDKFERYYRLLQEGQTGMIPEASIDPVEVLPDARKLDAFRRVGRAQAERTVIIKLNGGLGTSMGMSRAKALLPVKEGLTFLDIIARQTLHLRETTGARFPLVFMNSAHTREDTLQALAPYPLEISGLPLDFVQHRVPKVRQSDLKPVVFPENPELEWCPPGHGDIYEALAHSGLLEKLLSHGMEYAFISNVDNLGAVMSWEILGYFAEKRLSFMMEAAGRTPIDTKGGHLARRKDGRLILREVAQCPPEDMETFQDIRKHRYFNTNTIWLNLKVLERMFESGGLSFQLPLIRNKKTVNPQDPLSEPVYHLETAMGAAISEFENAGAVHVPRSRFAPVKTCQDMITLWSDAYILTDAYHLELHPECSGGVITRLDPKYYKMIRQLEARFPDGAPSLRQCKEWHVSGDVKFGGNVTLKGVVRIINKGPVQAMIPDGTIYENETVELFHKAELQ